MMGEATEGQSKVSGDDGRSYDSVADIGELYDHVGIYAARRDVGFYVDVAREVGGRVLELGCGTGRVLLPIARAGLEIAGLDRSPSMLQRCIAKVALEPPAVRGRIALHEGDMRTFELETRFDVAIAPFRGVQHLIAAHDQESFFRNVRRHLEPGGRLVFDVFNPDPARLATPASEESEDTPWTPLDGGRRFRRTARVVAIDHAEQVSSVELIWYVRDGRGDEQRRVQAFPMRWFRRDEVVALVERCGFTVRDVYGTLDPGPFTDRSPEIVIVADRAE
jgi:SAM-dependent methyltransferase